MCGSIKMSWMEKAVFTGQVIRGVFGDQVPFGGFIRSESLDKTWADRILDKKQLDIEGFTERNRETGQVTYFSRPGKITVFKVNDFAGKGVTARILTEPSDPEVRSVHHRQPVVEEG